MAQAKANKPKRKPLRRADSAGGVVYAVTGGELKFLLIKHVSTHHWSFPKGYVESGESLEATAVREVAEETGITAEIEEFLGHVHIFTSHPHYNLRRKLHAYLMRAAGNPRLDPAKFDPVEQMIGDVEWVTPEEARRRIVYKNLYPIIDRAIEKTRQHA